MRASDYIIQKTKLDESSDKTLKSFSNMLKHAPKLGDGNVKLKFIAAVEATIAEFARDDLYNSAYKERWSFTISRGLEKIWELIFEPQREKLRKLGDAFWDVASFDAARVAKIAKLVKQYPELFSTDMISFIHDMSDLKHDRDRIKAVLKSGRKPAEPKPGTFIRPMASMDARRMAKRIADESVASFRQELELSTKTKYLNAFSRIMRPGITFQELATIAKGGGIEAFLMTRFVRPDPKTKTFTYTSIATASEANRLAMAQVSDIIDGFVGKMILKLSAIFERKSEISEYRITSSKVVGTNVDAVLFVKFTDGSNFTVYSQSEYSYSVNGKMFLRYPTRFTNVFFADGKKMAQPSEEKMNRTF